LKAILNAARTQPREISLKELTGVKPD